MPPPYGRSVDASGICQRDPPDPQAALRQSKDLRTGTDSAPWIQREDQLGGGAVRASISPYNSAAEVDRLLSLIGDEPGNPG
jgi:selenocysteine lyase/cysteine desulfurase